MNKIIKPHQKNLKTRGQVMLITVLVLAAVFLSATVISGLLMVYQLSQVTRIADSAKAIFAADAAMERALFKVFRCNPGAWPSPLLVNADKPCDYAGIQTFSSAAPPAGCGLSCIIPAFYNGATYQLTIFKSTSHANPCSGGHTPTVSPGDVTCIRATGRAGKAARAFELRFD